MTQACDASLRRLGASHSDLSQLHAFDALIPLDETLRAGKVRYILRDAATDPVSSLVIGSRNQAQLKDNLGTVDFQLSADQTQRLN